MKKILYILAMAVATMFASCQKDSGVVDSATSDGAVKFSAESISLLTKVSGTSWDENDAIGITMLSSSDNSTIIYDNIKYTAETEGTNVSFNPTTQTILYPQDGSAVNFVAYYPYQESWSYEGSSMLFDLSVQDGTDEGQEMADLLESSASDKVDGDVVSFQFTHTLSKVQITVSNYDAVSAFENLDNLTATLYTKRTQYDLADGDVVLAAETKALGMVKTTDGDKAIFTAIFAPGEVSDEIIFSDGTSFYTATLAISDAEAAKLYSFSATVGDQGLSIVELVSDSVTDWTTQGDTAMGVDLEIVDGVYQIYTAKGMTMFASIVNSGSYSINGKLMCNIDLEGSADNKWTPMGIYEYYQKPYTGKFDGGGFELSGLYVDDDSDYYKNGAGLFSFTSGATIENLSVSGSVNGMFNIAGIVGFAIGTTFTNCHSSVTVTGEYGFIGGIAGCSDSSTFESCSNSGKVSLEDSNSGGIVGLDSNSTFTNCYNLGSVEGNSNVGGVVGRGGISTMINCYNLGSVEGSSNYIGGVMGYNLGSTISNCYNAGAITNTGSTTYIGGVVGYIEVLSYSIPAVSDCYFNSTIYTGNAVGGIADGYDYTVTNTFGYSTTYMQGDEFVKLLNDWVDTYNDSSPDTDAATWVAVDEGYPTFSFLITE